MNEVDCDSINLIVVSNEGEETKIELESTQEAKDVINKNATTGNHMICLEIDGIRTKRWDRERVVGENNWHAVDPDEMETLGPIRQVHRRG